MPDCARQLLAQGKSLNGQDFVRSKRSSKRAETMIWRLQGTPGNPLGRQNVIKNPKKLTFPMSHPKLQNALQKIEFPPGNGFFVPRATTMKCQTAPASAWPKAKA